MDPDVKVIPYMHNLKLNTHTMSLFQWHKIRNKCICITAVNRGFMKSLLKKQNTVKFLLEWQNLFISHLCSNSISIYTWSGSRQYEDWVRLAGSSCVWVSSGGCGSHIKWFYSSRRVFKHNYTGFHLIKRCWLISYNSTSLTIVLAARFILIHLF